jgi:hypothetical protein
LVLLIVVAVVAAIIAFVLPKKQAEANHVPTRQQASGPVQRAQTGAYKAPASN